MMKKFSKLIWIGGGLVVLAVGWWAVTLISSKPTLPESREYQAAETGKRVVKIASDLGLVTRVKLTPDNRVMLVANLTGDVWALVHDGNTWVRQSQPVYQVKHGMNPASENGMTGLIISSDYTRNQFIFLTYTQRQPGGRGENTVLRLKLERQDESYVGVEPKVIFKGNTTMLGAHQIQGGVGMKINNRPHLLFAIGEGYQEQQAKDIRREAGKLMLIQEDGSDPVGRRPYPDFPRIQAIGIRNVYDIVIDRQDKDWVYFTENGPDANDSIVHAPLFDGQQYDFNWRSENNPESLLRPLVNGTETPELIIRNWEVTVSPTDIESDASGRVYFNIFSSSRYPNKEVVMGEEQDGQWNWKVIVRRKPGAAGGNPLGLAVDRNGQVIFGDMSDGAVYALVD